MLADSDGCVLAAAAAEVNDCLGSSHMEKQANKHRRHATYGSCCSIGMRHYNASQRLVMERSI